MTDSVEKCLIDLIKSITTGQTSEDVGFHSHSTIDNDTKFELSEIRERLKKLGESNDIHSKIRENPENR